MNLIRHLTFSILKEFCHSLKCLLFYETPLHLGHFKQSFLFQVRDEYRTDYDAGRGGYGMIMKQKLELPDFIK